MEMRQFHDKWIEDTVWVEAIKEQFDLPIDQKITRSKLNRAIARDPIFKSISLTKTTEANGAGLYKATYKPWLKGKSVTITGYYATSAPHTLPEQQGGDSRWHKQVLVSQLPTTRTTRSTTKKRSLPESVATPVTPPVPSPKRGRVLREKTAAFLAEPRAIPNAHAQAILEQSYWESPEALKLFGELGPDSDNSDIQHVVEDRITRLQDGFAYANGWRQVVDDADENDIFSSHDIFRIQLKCRYVSLALRIALERMPTWTWKKCLLSAIERINKTDGMELVKNSETVRNWHCQYRNSKESWPNPRVVRKNRTPDLPPFLDLNPEVKEAILLYAKENINNLSGELILTYLHEKVLPELLVKWQQEQGDPEFTYGDLLKANRLRKLTLPTVYRWMNTLGFKYEPRKKCCYVDGHERPEVKQYRNEFVQRYLGREFRMHRWVSLSKEKVEAMVEEDEIKPNEGYEYTDPLTGRQLIEFHVDVHPTFLELGARQHQLGGNVSVRKATNDKPLICIGQGECIFKQNLFSNKAWTTPDGQKALMPKDEGLGIMISAMVSREFGFGFKLSDDNLACIDEERRGQRYKDETAARTVNGTTTKPPLKDSPFVFEFEYGAASQGYWDYDRMVLQLEDCIDVLRWKFPEDDYDFVFLFDHSCGHDRQRPDGLSVTRMSRGYGGAQARMRDSEIKNDQFLGSYWSEHASPLRIGDPQSMVFKPDDPGPFWFTDEEKQMRKFDRLTDKVSTKRKTKRELQQELGEKGVSASGSLKHLQDLASLNEIPLSKQVQEVEEGWVGKAKGMYQVLWERGFIDPAQPATYYTLHGREDRFGNIIAGTSLIKLMENQVDFIAEETLLQFHGRQMGVLIDRTTKCHPELAGEGIEYSWGCAKSPYRRIPMEDKKSKDKFRQSVRRCLSNGHLTVTRQRMFSRRARQYILAYLAMEQQQGGQQDMSAHLIEKIVKKYKSHRSAVDFDTSFIGEVVSCMVAL